MKILLTGSTGFVGQHLMPRLKKNGHSVIELKSDLRNHSGVKDEVLHYDPDLVIHLAAKTEVAKSFYEPIEFSEVNYVGTVNLINACCELKNLKNFMFASTMEVYGWQPISDVVKQGHIPETIPIFDENTTPNPNAPYAVAKYACEKYLEYAHRSMGLPFCALRQTNSYGRTDNNFFVVEQIISQMLSNETEIYLGYKEPYRNFLFINDLIDLWTNLVENYKFADNGCIFTIGPNNPIKIEALAKKISGMLNWEGDIFWNKKAPRCGEIYVLNSDHKLISSLVDWQPVTSLDQGLEKTINIWRSKYRDEKKSISFPTAIFDKIQQQF